ncbi:MAG: hydrogenase [Actinobacteria bacterium HGW-Actinobacteria-7]|jgi:hydrogenase small subunit|nr:MAG: hydrogenase [Actinobacteria bacterium HGW-Actinobacteria-7]
MAYEDRAFAEQLAARGVTRRDFVKFCGSVAAMLGLSESMVPTIASAVESAAGSKLYPAVWVNGGACTGCTESMAQATYPDVATVVLDILSMNYMETVMMAMGADAEKALYDTVNNNEGKAIMIYEGSVMKGWDGNALRVAGEPSLKILDDLAPKVAAIIAVGSCAVDGGWVKAGPNTADATGVSMYLAEKGIKTPVINLPTCPVNPEWIVAMVVDVLLLGELESGAILGKLDAQGRPKLIFGQTIHDNCPRRGHFENGEFVYQFGSPEEAKGYCLYAMGCKGPQTQTNCPIVRWNNQTSWCVESGSPCIGCGNFNWVDNGAPFLGRMRKVAIGSGSHNGGFAPGVAGAAVGGVVAAALGVHAIGMAATGRLGNMPDTEDVKEHDRKKGGDK